MTWLSRLLLLASLLLLAACAAEEYQDIKEWMRESSADMKGNVPPLPELKAFPVVAYDGSTLVDPFSGNKVVPERSMAAGGKTPDFDRPKEPLEAYPLESLKLAGIILPGVGNTKTAYALIRSNDGLSYVVVGSHLGQNFGVVTAITASDVKIKETVKDPTGQTADWVDRPVSLYLEGAKK
ncbi:MAG: pilus assembly protein PilP [Sulfurisoma sp.]|nr:pilus assembly protein PilP [Sulfurisoma sp.]